MDSILKYGLKLDSLKSHFLLLFILLQCAPFVDVKLGTST